MTMQPCTSLEHFLQSLVQYQNPPKRQRGENRAVRIQLPNLDSFLEINKEWLPLAKAQAAAREKFGELANAQKTRSKKMLQKRLREESIPDLPPDMLQQILNVVPYNTPKELVPDFANTFEVASPWPGMAHKALCDKINREKIPIIDLGLDRLEEFKFILRCGPYLQHLDLATIPLDKEQIYRVSASCINLTFLNLSTTGGISLNLTPLSNLKSLKLSPGIGTTLKLPLSLEKFQLSIISDGLALPELPRLEDLKLHIPFITDLVIPSYPSLKTLDINGGSLVQLTLNPQPNLTTCDLKSNRLMICHFPHLPIIKELVLRLPLVKILNLDHLHSLHKLKIIGVWNLQQFSIPEELLEFEILGGLNFHELNLASINLKILKLTSGEINRLSLDHFPNLSEIDFQGDGLRELRFKTDENYSHLKRLRLKSDSIEQLILPTFEALTHVDIECKKLTALNFSAIAHCQELELNAEKLSLNAVIDPERYKSLNISARDFEIRDPF